MVDLKNIIPFEGYSLSSREDYFEYLKNRGYMLWSGEFLSHSELELISMFKKNVTNKYFGK